ncbi:hypothetical protein LH464_11900 [Neorhizobium sp. T786]|uniref:hypothetical protein n=1 Tax=Pseudorhizobium xiangyangii TaxID=2883104 RepID=UPI001CFFB0BB|nr:hypothetical protein [Neorhizobium xiangyangii]MCB5203173.1 hypothetical protein [Neorhizobium xiangyangii]
MKLTVLIPLVGFFLLFNQYTESLLTLPNFLREDLGLQSGPSLSPRNLYYTYFGLCFLGVGSFLFAIFCPREIGSEPNIDRYVINAPSINAPVIAKDDFRTLLDLRFSGLRSSDDDAGNTPDFPDELGSEFHGLMEELYKAVDDDVDGAPEVMLGSGYLDFTKLARSIWNNVRAQWVWTQPFYSAAPNFARDIAFVKYRFLDYTRFRMRLAVALVYLVGFLLLLKPTLHATALLALAWLQAG